MNQLIDSFAKLSVAVKAVALLVVLAIIAAVEYQMFFLPQKQSLEALQKQSKDLRSKLVENQTIADNLERFQEEYNVLSEQLKQAVALLPNEANIHTLLRQLSIAAKKTNVDIMSFRPAGSKSRGFYSEINMELKLKGTFHDIASFIDQVGKFSRIINMSDITLLPAGGAKKTIVLNVDCKATTFVFAGGSSEGAAERRRAK